MPKGDKVKKLQEAGLVIGALPAAHEAVLEGLSDGEVATLISVYESLSEADVASGHKAIPGEKKAFASLIVI